MRLIQIFEILLVIAFVVGKQLHANSEKTPVLPFDAPCASLSTVSPSCFRAKGDGVVDDTVAFQKLIDFCSMERCSIDLGLNKYLISSSLFITSPIRIVGGAALGESEHGFQLIAADNFRGNALLFIGQDGVAGVNGVTLQGVGLDCRYFCKRVLSIFGGANVTLRDVKVRRGLGVGIYANGLWVSNWYNLSSRYNRGGGVHLHGKTREVSDVRIFGVYANNNSLFQLKLSGAKGVKAADFYSALLEFPEDDSPLLILEDVHRSRFFGGQFAQQKDKLFEAVFISDIHSVSFLSPYFQNTNKKGAAIKIRGNGSVTIDNAETNGVTKLIDCEYENSRPRRKMRILIDGAPIHAKSSVSLSPDC